MKGPDVENNDLIEWGIEMWWEMNVGLLEREKCKLILFFGLSFNIFSPLYTNTNMLPPCNFISVLLVFILCLKCVTSVTPPAQLEVVLEIRVWEVKRGCRKCVCLRWKARYTAVKGQWLHSLLFLWDFFFFNDTQNSHELLFTPSWLFKTRTSTSTSFYHSVLWSSTTSQSK